MSCRRVQGLLLEYVFDDMGAAQRAALESHLDGCPRCRQRVSGLRRLWRALPEPYPAALEPQPATWERSWSAILERITLPAEAQAAAGIDRRPTFARGTAVAASLCLAFLLGLHWPDLRLAALRMAGRAPAYVPHVSGLETFQSASHGYLQRTRLLLLEVRQSEPSSGSLADTSLVSHSRSLLGEAPRHLTAAREVRNPHLEALLFELEDILRQILERGGGAPGGLPTDLEDAMDVMLFKLEMLERPPAPHAAPAMRPLRL